MRLSARSTVVLPQPDGPMKAEISLRATSRCHVGDRAEAAVVHLDVAEVEDDFALAVGTLAGGVLGTRFHAVDRRPTRAVAERHHSRSIVVSAHQGVGHGGLRVHDRSAPPVRRV